MLQKLPSLFPWKHNKTKIMAEPVLEEDVNLEDQLAPCAICGRTFLPVPLAKHFRVCEKNATKKRKVFDSLKQRVEGTDLAPFHQPSYLKRPELPNNNLGRAVEGVRTSSSAVVLPTWKEKHQELVSAIRAAKGTSVMPSTPTPNRQRTPNATSASANFERCPSCERQFGPKAFDRHVEWCKERRARLPQSPAGVQAAKERLEARIKYRVPAMNRPKRTVREKYQSPAKSDHQLPASKSLSNLERKPSVRVAATKKILPDKIDKIVDVKPEKTRSEPIKSIGKKLPMLKVNTTRVNSQTFGLTVESLNTPLLAPKKLVTWSDIIRRPSVASPTKLERTSRSLSSTKLPKLVDMKGVFVGAGLVFEPATEVACTNDEVEEQEVLPIEEIILVPKQEAEDSDKDSVEEHTSILERMNEFCRKHGCDEANGGSRRIDSLDYIPQKEAPPDNSAELMLYENTGEFGEVESLTGIYGDAYSCALSKARLERGARRCCSEVAVDGGSGYSAASASAATYSETDLSKFCDEAKANAADELLLLRPRTASSAKSESSRAMICDSFAVEIYESCLSENIKRIRRNLNDSDDPNEASLHGKESLETDDIGVILEESCTSTVDAYVDKASVEEDLATAVDDDECSSDPSPLPDKPAECSTTLSTLTAVESTSKKTLDSTSASKMTRGTQTTPTRKYSAKFVNLVDVILRGRADRTKADNTFFTLSQYDCVRLINMDPKRVPKMDVWNSPGCVRLPKIGVPDCSSAVVRSASPREKRHNLKRTISLLDPVVKPKNLRNKEDVQNYFDEREARSTPVNVVAKTKEPSSGDNIFSIDDEMYEEYKRYEQMYLQEKEEKMRQERNAVGDDEALVTKISGDSAYGSLSRGKPKARTRVTKLTPLEHRAGSASSSGSETCFPQTPQQLEVHSAVIVGKMPKFCHECGSKYPVSTAKYCIECGVKRLPTTKTR